jgi:hypothetical protein
MIKVDIVTSFLEERVIFRFRLIPQSGSFWGHRTQKQLNV